MRIPATRRRSGESRTLRRWVGWLGLVVLLLGPTTDPASARAHEASADTIALVLQSTAGAVEEGTFLEAGQRIVLEPDERVVLVLADGKTRALRGRFAGTLAEPVAAGGDQTAFFEKLQRMWQRRDEFGGPVGAVRSVSQCRESPDTPLDLPVRSTGIVCVPALGPVRFRRHQAGWEGALTVISVNSNQAATVVFPSGVCVADWPGDLPLNPDEAYFLRYSGDPFRRSAILIRTVGTQAGKSPIPAMVLRACEMQIQAWLTATLTAPAPGDSGTGAPE